jgi:Pentapeptide repeats (8 copies)
MANTRHLQRLNNVNAWNSWRAEHFEEFIDLSSATLSSADLSGAILSRTFLSGADLSGADLERADLSGANLRRADLRNANLRSANLRSADLSGAILSGAILGIADLSGATLRRTDLRRADLSGADLSGADLSGADLRGTNVWQTNFTGADLDGAIFSDSDASTERHEIDGVIERHEIEVEIALPQENINYTDLERLQMAIDELMEVCEFELKGELDPVRGSWWQKLIFWSKDKTTQTAVNRILQTVKEVFVARSIGIPSAEETIKLTEAVDKVIKSLEPFEGGVIRLGKLLVVKGTLRGKSVLRVETISLSLAQRLADNPQLINMPQQLLLLIEEPEFASQEVSISTLAGEQPGYIQPAESVMQLPPGGKS